METFVESTEKYRFKRNLLGFVLSILVGIIGVFQTEFFVSLLPSPADVVIREHIARCRKIQDDSGAKYIRKWGGQLPRGIVLESFDGPAQLKVLEEAKTSLLNDETLQAELRNEFGACFRDLNVVVIPAWKMDSVDNNEVLGITIDGWRQATTARGELDVGGFTLRDRPLSASVTVDGRPRIVLNPKAFETAASLRVTLYHELLHAMNIPGFYPWPLTFAQNDLIYLPRYRAFLRREGLGVWTEVRTWVLAVLVPWFIAGLIARPLRAYAINHRHRTQLRM